MVFKIDKLKYSLIPLLLVIFFIGWLLPAILARAAYTSVSATLSREEASVVADWTITIVNDSASWSANNTLVVDFDDAFDFTAASLSADDVDVRVEGTDITVVNTGCVADEIQLAGVFGAGAAGPDILTFTLCAGSATLSDGGDVGTDLNIVIEIGTHATFGATGVYQILNPATPGSYIHAISGTIEGPSDPDKTFATVVVDSDQVSVTANVDANITFDIDTAQDPTTETNAPYTVNFGSIPASDVRVSGATDGINAIALEASTNASGGMVVTVSNVIGGAGLVSASVPTDDIGSAVGTMSAGAENYGICVATADLSGFSTTGNTYDGNNCALNANNNDIETLLVAGEEILNSAGGPVVSAHATIVANAAASSATAAHDDYSDVLTFIATGTF